MLATLRAWLKKWFQPSLAALATENPKACEMEPELSGMQLVPYNATLLEKSRTQWQFGDWPRLVQLGVTQ